MSQSKINDNLDLNRVTTTVKAFGQDQGWNTIAPTVDGFDGNSNEGITDALIAGTGQIGLTISNISGSTLGAADTVRKTMEVEGGNLMFSVQDGLNNKVNDTEMLIQASGLYKDIHGQWRNADGDVVTTPYASGTSYEITSGEGDKQSRDFLTNPINFHYRHANTIVDKELPLRTQ